MNHLFEYFYHHILVELVCLKQSPVPSELPNVKSLFLFSMEKRYCVTYDNGKTDGIINGIFGGNEIQKLRVRSFLRNRCQPKENQLAQFY